MSFVIPSFSIKGEKKINALPHYFICELISNHVRVMCDMVRATVGGALAEDTLNSGITISSIHGLPFVDHPLSRGFHIPYPLAWLEFDVESKLWPYRARCLSNLLDVLASEGLPLCSITLSNGVYMELQPKPIEEGQERLWLTTIYWKGENYRKDNFVLCSYLYRLGSVDYLRYNND